MPLGNLKPDVCVTEDWKNAGFGIYIHWPFCQAKCPYCDFNSHVSAEIDIEQWRHAYLAELDRYALVLPDRLVNSVFFGGGTPSLMPGDLVGDILDKVHDLWPLANDVEVTLEANPTSVESSRFADYRRSGVNRLSVGIQSFSDDHLRSLGRLHSASEARQALEMANQHFDRVSFDLIYARQDQSMQDWEKELSYALALEPDHLSLYQLTIEDGTAFGRRQAEGKLLGLPDDGLAAEMYAVTQVLCDQAGLPAYEISNHARSGAESRHNLIYWRYGDYLGIGPGAHGRLTLEGKRYATEHYKSPADWLTAVKKGGAECRRDLLSDHDQATEYLMMGLRLSEGVDLTRLNELSSGAVNVGNIKDLKNMGLISESGSRLVVTPSSRIVLNSILQEILAD